MHRTECSEVSVRNYFSTSEWKRKRTHGTPNGIREFRCVIGAMLAKRALQLRMKSVGHIVFTNNYIAYDQSRTDGEHHIFPKLKNLITALFYHSSGTVNLNVMFRPMLKTPRLPVTGFTSAIFNRLK